MAQKLPALLLALGVLIPSPSLAARFDFIYADQITVHASLESWGVTLAGLDFGIIVNRGLEPLDADTLYAAEFTVDGVPVRPDPLLPIPNPRLWPGFNSLYLYHSSFSPIQPDEGLASVGPDNGVLTTLMGASETFRNCFPTPFIYFEIHGFKNAPGVVRFDVQLRIGDDHADFPMFFTLIESPTFSIHFDHAARVSSVSGPTAARVTTWGRVKMLYR